MSRTQEQSSFKLGVRMIPSNGRLKKARTDSGMSQEAFATLLGIATSHYSSIERMCYYPKAKLRGRILEAVRQTDPDCTMESLFPECLAAKVGRHSIERTTDIPLDRMLSMNDVAELPDPKASAEKRIINQQLSDELRKALSTLGDRDRDIVVKRFGLFGSRKYTIVELGHRYNLSKERVRQMEWRAIKRLRHPDRAGSLGIFLEK